MHTQADGKHKIMSRFCATAKASCCVPLLNEQFEDLTQSKSYPKEGAFIKSMASMCRDLDVTIAR